jgi:hypothetical protein
MNQAATSDGQGMFERVGWRAERRPEPGFAHALGAGAAVFLVLAVFFLIAEVVSNDPTGPGIAFYGLLSVAAFLVGAQATGPIRAAAVTTLVLSIPLVWAFLLVGDGGGSGARRGIYLLTIASYGVLYFLTWTKGRAIFLGLLLLVVAGWITGEVQGFDRGSVPFESTFEDQSDTNFDFGGSSNDFSSDDDFSFEESDNNTTETSIVAIIIGLAYLAAATVLDKKRLAGAATPFIVVGLIFTVAGAFALGSEESLLGGGIALVASGAVVGVVGGWGRDRRFSTWFGVVLVVIGFLAIVSDIVSGGDGGGGSPLGYAGAFALTAIALGAAAWYAAPRLNEFLDGDINAPKTSDTTT